MKRTTLALVLLAALPLAAACGSDDAASTTTAAPTTAAAATTVAPTTAAPTTAAPTTAARTTAAPTTAVATTAAKPTTTAAAPTTAAPTTGAAAPAMDADQQAASDAYAIVFDSTTSFDQKAAHLADAESVRATIEAYGGAGSSMGGIALKPTAVTVDGDTATVTYDVMFGGTAAYQDLTGTITKVGDTWQVTKVDFCGFMASARTPCA